MPRRFIQNKHSLKFITTALAAALAPALTCGQGAPGMVYENPLEFQSLADVNGDGADDIIIADKASGQFRVAEGQGDGTIAWRTNIGDSGLSPLTGFSAGRVLQAPREQLVFSATLANRIQIVDTPDDSRTSQPLRVPNASVGPKVVTAINIPGGNSDYDPDFLDLVHHATLLDPANPDILRVLRNDDGLLPFASEFIGASANLPPRRPNRIEIEAGNALIYGVLHDEQPGTTLRLLDPSDGLQTEIASISGLPEGAAYVYADFDQNDAAEFVFYTPGSNTLHETEWTGSGLTPPASFTYPSPVVELRVIQSTGRPELLVIHAGRGQADRVLYSGGGSFNIEESFTDDGASIQGALSLGEHLHLLDGDGASGSSRSFEYDGNAHQQVATQDLPDLRAGGPAATVLFFDAAPLTDPEATLLARYNAGPWTSSFTIGGGSAEVVSERFIDPDEGLGDPRAETIRSLPVGVVGGLTNQVAEDNSLFFKDAAVGEIPSSLSVTPRSGTYDRAIRPQFELQGSGDIYYRTSTRVSGWTRADAPPPLILEDTTLWAVAVNAKGLSNVVRVDYTISEDPGTRDSNGDGLPDFAAFENGLDPLAESHDADGDGFTDLQEILAGTDPNSAGDAPARSAVAYEYPNSFDLFAAPAIPDPGAGTNALRPYAVSDTPTASRLVVHQPDGFFLGAESTSDNAALPYPAGYFEALDVVADDLFLVTATDRNFPVNATLPENYGRQVAGLVKMPAMEFAPFDYNGFGSAGGYDNLTAETAAWVTAAQSYFQNLQRPKVVRDPVDPETTLELLLVESILGQKLAARALSDRTSISLTPFRAEESPLEAIAPGAPLPDPIPKAERDRKVSVALLKALQRRPNSGTGSAYRIDEVIDTVRTKIDSAGTTGIQQLKTLAETLYTTSATATTEGSLRQPLDALRRFIRTGDLLNTGYDAAPAAVNFPAGLLSDAAQGVIEITAAIRPRSVESVTLYVSGDEATSNCPTWQEVVFDPNDFDPDTPQFAGNEYALLDDQGDPFPVARAFPLTTGSVFRVTGYRLDTAPCGNAALEVIPQPELAFLRNAPANDLDGDLIPDDVEARKPQASLTAFGDSDGDGYTDLQELLEGSDPLNGDGIPMDGNNPAPVRNVSPPQLEISAAGSNSAVIDFNYPADFARYIEFELYSTNNLTSSFTPTGDKANHLGNGNHQLMINQSGDKRFFIFNVGLK